MQAGALHYNMQYHRSHICLTIVLQEGPFC
nr:MAG TPA: hypothetical protein [Caudoviricetes sp.]DAN23231.1 MAG TPA_asm: hypothetical protein [Bacteriophage sp.]